MSKLDCFTISEQGPNLDTNDDFVTADAEVGVFVVADGMGGRPGGAQASCVAAKSFLEQVRSLDTPSRMDEPSLRRAVAVANNEVRSIANANPLMSGLGTTLSAVILNGMRGKIVHVGDSRISLFRKGKLEQLTKDHTLVAELVERKHLSAEGARRHPLRHVLSRSLGTQEMVEPDIGDLELTPNDWLVLATDGLTKALEPDHLSHIIEALDARNAEEMCRGILGAVMTVPPEDDITIAVVRLVKGRSDGLEDKYRSWRTYGLRGGKDTRQQGGKVTSALHRRSEEEGQEKCRWRGDSRR